MSPIRYGAVSIYERGAMRVVVGTNTVWLFLDERLLASLHGIVSVVLEGLAEFLHVAEGSADRTTRFAG
ncbi:hypothetical protein [Nibrella saemangeumensis]|uniref:hypothetical protein n=1 Tax=Nibrella saemangeumensis TaxID=1084526 RepID=UPI0031E7FEE3